jgi:hypothetical protein
MPLWTHDMRMGSKRLFAWVAGTSVRFAIDMVGCSNSNSAADCSPDPTLCPTTRAVIKADCDSRTDTTAVDARAIGASCIYVQQ